MEKTLREKAEKIFEDIDRNSIAGINKENTIKILEKCIQEAIEGKWIEVSEGLPEDSGKYVVCDDLGNYELVDYTMDDNGIRRFFGNGKDIEIIKWKRVILP